MINLETPKNSLVTLFLLSLALPLSGCGGGGGGGDGGGGGGGGNVPPPAGAITIQPGSFDFGLVTEGNLENIPVRQFLVRNTGTASYNVTSIRLEGTDPADFILDATGEETPCGTGVRSLGPDESCAVSVEFSPRNFGDFGAELVVQSSHPLTPTVKSDIQGSYAEVLAVNVAVNQVQACPRELPAKAYVSVRDQGGFPVRGLGLQDFALEELGHGVDLDFVDSVGNAGSTLSLSIVMDYSESITNHPDVRENMEAAARTLVEKMREEHEADIIKFGLEVVPMLEDFTSDKAALLAAIDEDPGVSRNTRLYLAILAAVDRIKVRTMDRKAVVALTDGMDGGTTVDIDDVIGAALVDDVPVFTVGFGDVDAIELARLADETGGKFYWPEQSENLPAVYQQLANLLFDDQYVLSFQSGLASDQSGAVQVSVEFVKDGRGFQGSGSKTSRACPSP